MIQHRTVRVAGAELHYRDIGKGPAVLLLHAFPLQGDTFQPQWEALAGSMRLLIPDQRGFGRSGDGVGKATTMQMLAQDALEILDDAGVQTATVGGVSMGGYAAMALLREDPARVRALVLVDTQMGADDEAGKARREETAMNVLAKGMDVLAESMPARLLADTAGDALRQTVREMILGNRPEGAAAASRGMALRSDSEDILARFGNRALIVVGERDVLTPVAKAEAMASVMSDARVVRIPGAGHLSHLEAPDAFNAALRDFVASV